MKSAVLLLLCSAACFSQTDAKIERTEKLKAVRSVFVSGNNPGAQKVREELEKGKTCLKSSLKASDADATLDINAETDIADRMLGVRDWVISGNLTNAAGELLWSDSVRFEDAPFSNGGKTAGKLLFGDLKRQVCK